MKLILSLLMVTFFTTITVAHCGACGTGESSHYHDEKPHVDAVMVKDVVEKKVKSTSCCSTQPKGEKETVESVELTESISKGKQKKFNKINTAYQQEIDKATTEYCKDVKKLLSAVEYKLFISQNDQCVN